MYLMTWGLECRLMCSMRWRLKHRLMRETSTSEAEMQTIVFNENGGQWNTDVRCKLTISLTRTPRKRIPKCWSRLPSHSQHTNSEYCIAIHWYKANKDPNDTHKSRMRSIQWIKLTKSYSFYDAHVKSMNTLVFSLLWSLDWSLCWQKSHKNLIVQNGSRNK